MNVVKRVRYVNSKDQSKFKNLLRKDNGIRGSNLMPISSYATNVSRVPNKAPRYQFNNNDESTKTKQSSMGPPLEPPRTLKRKIITNSTSSKPESTSSGAIRPRVLASDSAAADTSRDFCTPKNRPTALRYISSSSRGGHSGARSARSSSTITFDPSVILEKKYANKSYKLSTTIHSTLHKAISEGRGQARGEIGMAAIDLRHPHLVLCQFSDTLLYTHTLTKINFFNPVEIIVPHTFCEGVQPNQLYKLIKDQYPQVNLTTVQRRHFNDATGRQNIQTLCAPQYSAVYLEVLHKFYALTAAAAVLKYVEYIQCIVFARESLKIEYHSSENTMIIDVGTATQLELVQPLVPSAGPSCCLLGILGPMYTLGGIRALRASILQPSCNKQFIENRLDAVQDLIDNESGLMTDLQDVIKKLSDIDKILFLCVESTNQNMDKVGEAQLNQTLLLKTTMDMVPKLIDSLKSADSGILRKIKMDFENPHYKEIAERIRNIIQEDAHLEKGAIGSLQRCFAVKPNINGLLDVARRTYSELIEDIQKIVEQLSETFDLPIRLNQNMMKGFHIVLPIAPKNRRHFNVEDLPPIFIQVQNSGASVTMTTEELVVLDQQAKESLNEIQKMSNIVISSLLKELRPFMFSLYKLCENVAELDILVALAHDSTIGSYIRPEFNNYMDIRNSVHPLLDYNSQSMPVPNDIFASPEQNFTIVTGPNMAGKSIYIKQIAIMQVMAQIGCFLPATNAVLRLCDRIFSRIGFNDSVELNASTFVYEIKEMQHIMKGLTKSSLVIIDELCRCTNEEEGTSIAWAICEELLMCDAFTFFTTHFTYLTRLQDFYFNVVNLHAAVAEEEVENSQVSLKRLLYTHKIEPGFSKIRKYGLALAAKTHLPEDTVKLAIELADLIEEVETPTDMSTPEQNDEKTLYKLYSEIQMESRKQVDSEEIIIQKLQKFKLGNPYLIEKIRAQRNSNSKTDSSANASSITPRQHESSNDFIKTNSKQIDDNNCNSLKTSPYARSSIIDESSNVGNVVIGNDIFNNKTSHTMVKSLTELLNHIGNDNEDSINVPMDTSTNPITRVEYDNIQNDKPNNNLYDHNLQEYSVSNVDDQQLSKNEDQNTNSNCNADVQIMEISDSENNDSCESSSDIADALTQVIKECSVEEANKSRSSSSDTRSLKEEFIQEVITEINIEITSKMLDIENIILTPPIGFRDE